MQQILRTNFTGLHATVQMHTHERTRVNRIFIMWFTLYFLWENVHGTNIRVYIVCACESEKGQKKSYFLFPLWEIVSRQWFNGFSHHDGRICNRKPEMQCAHSLKLCSSWAPHQTLQCNVYFVASLASNQHQVCEAVWNVVQHMTSWLYSSL